MQSIHELSLFSQIFLGIITGTMTGLTGASGMSVLISVLLALKISADQIIAATYVVAGANASSGIVPYLRKYKPSAHEYAMYVVPACLGSVVSYTMIAKNMSSGFLGLCLTGFMLVAGIYLMLNKKGEQKQILNLPQNVIGILSFCAGGIIGIFGGGGTIFITLALVILFGIQYHRALMLSLLMTVFTCFPLTVLSYIKGSLIIEPIIVILVCSVPCALVAANFANKVPENVIKRVLGVYLICISIYLFMGKI